MSDQTFEIVKILLDKGVLALVVVGSGFWLKQWNEKRVAKLERHYVPRVELDLSCRFLGPAEGEYLVELSMTVNNKGKTQRKFRNMKLRLLGIADGMPLKRWARQPGKVEFPLKLLEDDLVPQIPNETHYYYVEPEVQQRFTYVTKIPENVRFVLGHLEFRTMQREGENKDEDTFTEERLFEVIANKGDDGGTRLLSGNGWATTTAVVATSGSSGRSGGFEEQGDADGEDKNGEDDG